MDRAAGLRALPVWSTESVAWIRRIADDPSVKELIELARRGGLVSGRGAVGSSTVLVTAALREALARPILMVVAHLDEADEAVDELTGLGVDATRFPAMELSRSESSVSIDLLAERLMLVRRYLDDDPPPIVVAPIQALMQAVPQTERLDRMLRVIEVGQSLDSNEFAGWLDGAGYTRVATIDGPGEFAIRGGIIDVFPAAGAGSAVGLGVEGTGAGGIGVGGIGVGGLPVRIDLFGDQVEGLFEIDIDTMGSDRRLERVQLVGASVETLQSDDDVGLVELMSGAGVAVLCEMIEIAEQGRSYFDRAADARGIHPPSAVLKAITDRLGAVIDINQYSAGGEPQRSVVLPVGALPSFAEDVSTALLELAELAGAHETIVLCQNDGERQRMRELLAELAPQTKLHVETRYLHRGLVWGGSPTARPLALVPYHELLHRYQMRRRIRRATDGRPMDAFLDLQPGDLVVHRDHGIARFAGLCMLRGGSAAPQEFLTLEFAGRAKLHVPASKIDLVQRYIGAFRERPELAKLGGQRWKRQKAKVKEAVRDLADQMLQIEAAREASPGIRYPADTAWQKEFEAEFPYEETEDQLAAIAAVKRDMSAPRPMDRLICGDVGFGKTEIAVRAAFKAAEYGKQVAILVPTTVLAEQHERVFRERFADYPFRIESLSRFKTKKQQTELIEAVRKGQVDVIIGTHRLLSKDVRFADLGLVVTDEEQRFGVEHKQRLLEFRATADVLTLSATPIPRTLHMALIGLRDISSLSTPPLDRRAIVTEVLSYDSDRIRKALNRELAREGQVFFVHNRVHNIESVADEVRRLAPRARVIVGHGQMPTRQLESVMLKFVRGEADILVCTTIIESGIDIPTANTMLINDAHRFGLSELHQLRGRVGRYKHRAYCYLLLPGDRVISEVAMKRLRAIENFSMLGAGFKIALRDLEIRGAGNLLGAEQSGHIAAVGYEMYCQLLKQAVGDLKRQPKAPSMDTTIDIGVTGTLPKVYIPSDIRRMDAYRRLSRADDFETLRQIEHDLTTAYGDPPVAAARLLKLLELRIAATLMGIRAITRHEADIILKTSRPRDLQECMAGAQGTLRPVGGADAAGLVDVYYRPPPAYLEPDSLLTVLCHRLGGQRQPVPAAIA